jgi:hypothetical protein
MKKFAIPLALLASISTLTSCSNKAQTTTEAPAPQAVVETVPVAPAPDAMTPPVVPPATETTTPAMPTEVATGTTTTVAPVTRTETVNYTTPAGSDPVEFSVTVVEGVITAASATPKSTHEISNKKQVAFAGEIASKVVGKKISELSLSAVGWASLTTGAFNTFIQSF